MAALAAPLEAPAPAGPVSAVDLLAELRGRTPTLETERAGIRRAAERDKRRRDWRAAVPALVRPASAPVRAVVRRPVLAAVVLATTAATAATSMPSSPSTSATHNPAGRVAGVSTHAAVALPDMHINSATLENRDSDSRRSSNSRVSRNKRTPLSTTPKLRSMMKPGQTVTGTWILPAPGFISTCFCMRWGVMHEGVDIAKGFGVPIRAVGAGIVIKVGPAEGFGNWVVIQHSNGDVSIYGHMESYGVRVGQHVKAGQIIALEGSLGYSTGPHLHFEVHKGGFDGPPIDPVPWLRARGVTVPTYDPNG